MSSTTVIAAEQPAATKTEELVLSTWSAVSPFGVGADVFRAGVNDGHSALSAAPLDEGDPPFEQVGLIPDFDGAKFLGRKGTRSMDRLTAIAVTAVRELVAQCGPEVTAAPERIGLVMGTGWASVQTIMDTTRDSLTGDKPYHVDPARFPNTVMNKAAGQSAIWHTIRGPNTTIAGDRLTGLLALNYSMRLIRAGHCDQVLCGVAEEYSPQRAWLEWHAGTEDGRPAAIGEGSAIFLVETAAEARRAGRVPLARVRAVRFRAYADPAETAGALAHCIRDAMADADVDASAIALIAPLGADGTAGTAENEALADVLGGATPRRIDCRALTGDTSGVSTGFQLAAALAVADEQPLRPEQVALITGVDRDGQVGCVLLGGIEDRP
jgi:3-oxoacyl-[acyl-carrier-protein] synthase II